MTYTKRQWFVYRTEQCINLLAKTLDYMSVPIIYVKGSKYVKRINKINKRIERCHNDLEKFLEITKG